MISTNRLKQLIEGYYILGEETIAKGHPAELLEAAAELRAIAAVFQKLGQAKAYPGRLSVHTRQTPLPGRRPGQLLQGGAVMSKRYLRLDLEYEFDGMGLYMLKNNIERILAEDIPHCRIIFSRDTAKKEDLDEPKGRR